jgi:hypothetical protein
MHAFLSSFASWTEVVDESLDRQEELEALSNLFRFDVPPAVWSEDLLQIYRVRDDIVVDALLVNGHAAPYLAREFLRRNGPPDDMRARTFPPDFASEGQVPFTLVLEYSSRGFIAIYVLSAKLEELTLTACVDETATNSVLLWRPEAQRSLEDIAGLGLTPTLPVEDIQFFLAPSDIPGADAFAWLEALSDERGRSCIEVPALIWPWPGGP